MKLSGLNSKEVKRLQEEFGKNELIPEKKENFLIKIFHIICEPMFLLLIIAATIYFILGEAKDGVIMLIFVVGIIMIDIIQEWKTDKTLNALKDLSSPKISVLRDGKKVLINSSELVPGDIMYIHEGVKIPADGFVLECSSLKVDEASLTGESVGVWKSNKNHKKKDYWKEDYCYQGTLVIQGSGIIKVDKIGSQTEYGKIGLSVSKVDNKKTILQKQVDKLVKWCAVIAFALFLLVMLFTFIELKDYSLNERIISSILSGVTLAMAMIPEEFPVILTVFLSMGAFRLAKKNSLIKRLPAVETLGAISVLCVDKTGTITKNEMEVTDTYINSKDEEDMVLKMCMCCDEETFDPMENAMFMYAAKFGLDKKKIFKYKEIKDYPFDNETKIMGIAYKINKEILLTIKGSPESILKICDIKKDKFKKINNEIKRMQDNGLRVIAIASKKYQNSKLLPKRLLDENLTFDGLVGLIDPVRDDVYQDIKICHQAGVKVVMITGDNGSTAASIAKSIGIKNTKKILTGDEINKMSFDELKKKVKTISIFSRVIPEHKKLIVKAFQENGEVVAMTGDGVNDAAALKQADIGIAMGKRGSEVSREAADLILLDDNFTTIVDTIKDGRRIYDNIRKAIGYVLVIHIPIALASLFGPLISIASNDLILLPLHVVLLELIIDPTCSIVLERVPAESNIMNRKVRDKDENILSKEILIKSIIQGLVIFGCSFFSFIYGYRVLNNLELGRTLSLIIIMISNIFLVFVNASEYDYVYEIFLKMLKDKVMLIINLIMIMMILLVVYSPINSFLKLTSLSFYELFLVVLLSFMAVFWYEFVKLIKRYLKS